MLVFWCAFLAYTAACQIGNAAAIFCCRLVREFLEAAPSSAIVDAVDTLAQTGGNVLKMVHTHDGAAAACMLFAYGTPKDRKRLIKGMKGVCVTNMHYIIGCHTTQGLVRTAAVAQLQLVSKPAKLSAGMIHSSCCSDICVAQCVLPAMLAGHVRTMAENEWGNAVVCTALSVVDDTALVGKSILGELKVCV